MNSVFQARARVLIFYRRIGFEVELILWLFLGHIEKGAPYVFRDTFNCILQISSMQKLFKKRKLKEKELASDIFF